MNPTSKTKDYFALMVFISIPLLFYISSLSKVYVYFLWGVIIVFIIMYFLLIQFFYYKEKANEISGKLIFLALTNAIVLPTVTFSGVLESRFFFILILLILSTGILFTKKIVFLEGLVIFLCILFSVYSSSASFSVFINSFSSANIITLGSLFFCLPLTLGFSSYIDYLRQSGKFLDVSKELLAIQDAEDETLLTEIEQGLIVMDKELKILKISKWIEVNLELNPAFILGKTLNEIGLYDFVTGEKITETNHFFKNLLSPDPKQLNWQVLFKNQYGKLNKYIVRQTPVYSSKKLLGFILLIKKAQTDVSLVTDSINQLLIFRIYSFILPFKDAAMEQSGPSSTFTQALSSIDNLLKDFELRDKVMRGEYGMSVEKFDLVQTLDNLASSFAPFGKVKVWKISPLLQNSRIFLKSDKTLYELMIQKCFEAMSNFSQDKNIGVSIEDNLENIDLLITTTTGYDLSDQNLEKPFFEGRIMTLSKYKGSGLELSNAKLVAGYLGFDFRTEIRNNKVVTKIILKDFLHESSS